MTAKQKLLEYVTGLTEEEAEEKLPWLVGTFETVSAERRLSVAERAGIERGLADVKAGRFITLEEFEAEMADEGE